MKKHQTRLRCIELSLTPRQVVFLWLANVSKAKLSQAVLQNQCPREAIANSVLRTVRNAMKGETETIIERAVAQARLEADSLYNLIIDANIEIHESLSQRGREFTFLCGYMRAVLAGNCPRESLADLRAAVLMFSKDIVALDSAISDLSTDHLEGKTALFSDSVAKLRQHLEMLARILEYFNLLAGEHGIEPLELTNIRDSSRSEGRGLLSGWVMRARLTALSAFGKWAVIRSELNRIVDEADSAAEHQEARA